MKKKEMSERENEVYGVEQVWRRCEEAEAEAAAGRCRQRGW